MTEKPQDKPILAPKYPPGSVVSWNTIHGLKSGVTAGFRNGNYLVNLDNGKQVIVPESSIRE